MEQPKIFRYDTVDSTNTVCKSLAAQGAPSGTAVIARRQTAGRGRMGRSFESPEGLGLYLSVLWRPEGTPEDLLPLWQEVLAAGSGSPLPLGQEGALPAGLSHVLYVCCQPQGPVLLALGDKYPSAQLTVLQGGSTSKEAPLPAGARRILLTPGQVAQNLNGLTL